MVSLDITEPGPDEDPPRIEIKNFAGRLPTKDENGIQEIGPEPDPNRDITPTEIRLLINQWVEEQENANATKALIAHGVMQIKTSITAGEVTAKYTPGRYPRVTMIRRHPDV